MLKRLYHLCYIIPFLFSKKTVTLDHFLKKISMIEVHMKMN